MITHRGALPSQHLQQLIADNIIVATEEILPQQVQPASIDLRLGDVAYRVRASFLPGANRTVEDCLDKLAMHKIDLSQGAVLERDCVYIVPLMESLQLPENLAAAANPKSSTGRLDVFTRMIVDNAREFDQVPVGYQGALYAEICPQTFSVLVRPGSRLSQLRVRSREPFLDDAEHLALHQTRTLVDCDLSEEHIKNGIPLTADVSGEHSDGLIGYRAKRHAGVVDVDRVAEYSADEFWEPIFKQKNEGLILDPGEFYILASKEAVHVPVDHAAEMVAYDTLVGEFRVHYAGFFDPGFGAPEASGIGSRAVLEVRSYDVPFLLEDQQYVGRLVYECLAEMPERVYGADLNSNYQAQGLKLSKHFKM